MTNRLLPRYISTGQKGTSGLDYEAGELKAVGYDQPDGKGNVIATDVVNTSGDAAQVELSADRTYIKKRWR